MDLLNDINFRPGKGSSSWVEVEAAVVVVVRKISVERKGTVIACAIAQVQLDRGWI